MTLPREFMGAHALCWDFGLCAASKADPFQQHGNICQTLQRRDELAAASWASDPAPRVPQPESPKSPVVVNPPTLDEVVLSIDCPECGESGPCIGDYVHIRRIRAASRRDTP